MEVSLDQLLSLPVAEKLHIVEAPWGDIGSSGEPIVLRGMQRAELQRRAAK